jgi:hypothetical protein
VEGDEYGSYRESTHWTMKVRVSRVYLLNHGGEQIGLFLKDHYSLSMEEKGRKPV